MDIGDKMKSIDLNELMDVLQAAKGIGSDNGFKDMDVILQVGEKSYFTIDRIRTMRTGTVVIHAHVRDKPWESEVESWPEPTKTRQELNECKCERCTGFKKDSFYKE